MLTFAFTTLVLALSAVVGFFVYQKAQTEFRASNRETRRMFAKRLRYQEGVNEDLRAQIKTLDAQIRMQKGTPAAPVNLFSKMEERHTKPLKAVVGMGSETVPIG